MTTVNFRWSINTELIAAIKLLIWLGSTVGTLALAQASGPGRDLYLTAGGYGCGVCHGPVANGNGQAGGAIRGANREAFDKALAEQPTMQLLGNALSPDNIADLSRYLESLGQIPLVELVYTDLGWRITQEPVATGQPVQMVVFNDSFDDLALDLQAFGFAPTTISPMETRVLEWIAEAGTFFLPDNALLVVPAEVKK
jgi:mono/diheme cytochrome c family protein